MRMIVRVTFFLVLLLFTLAMDDIYLPNAESESVQEMRKAGKEQYQMLQERGKLPKYGGCWRAALELVEESCRRLSEETQSDVALHITNCFLEMSGHDTYNCESDRKPNLRAICLHSMTDRAFNVYTEFFTHAQNICWFLRGQLWQETIEENTRKVGKQLDRSTKNQEALLRNQQQSLELQERMLQYSLEVEAMLGRFVATTKQHQDLIQMLTRSVSNLQSWLIGEVSWLDSAIFYLLASFVVIFITSTHRAHAARLPMLMLLACNIFFERLLCHSVSRGAVLDAGLVHDNYYNYVSYLRYTFIALNGFTLAFYVLMYKDYLVENNLILENIKETISDLKHSLQPPLSDASAELPTPRMQLRVRLGDSTGTRRYYVHAGRESRDSSRSTGRYNLRTNPQAVTLNSFD